MASLDTGTFNRIQKSAHPVRPHRQQEAPMNIPRFALRAAVVTLPALLAACGGDSDNDVPPPVVAPASLALTGTAATGAAIAGGSVTAKCASGVATTATTNADGSYTLSVASGALPCVLQATPTGGAPSLYSVATGSGASATANITPLTQLVVARLTGADPAALFSGFSGATAATITSTALASAQAGVVTTLSEAGIDIGGLGDLITGTLTAASGGSAGNAYDVALDTLGAQLAATTDSDGHPMTLGTLTAAMASASPAAPPPPASAKASLPADLLLKPAASSCAALRSTTYRVVLPASGSTLEDEVGTIKIDAATLAVVYTDGSTGAFTAHPTEACRFTDETGHSDLVVSPAGVIALRSYDADTGTYSAGIAFPEQTHTLAELAGDWNTLGLESEDGGLYHGGTVSGTLSATGTVSNASSCGDAGDWNVSVCVPATNVSSFAVDPAGGYDAFDSGASVASGRSFAYRSGSGDLMMVNVDGDGSLEIRTPARPVEVPVVGRVVTTWDVRYSNTWAAAPAIAGSTNTIQSVDAGGASVVRLAKTVGGSDEHLETVLLNSPRSGYNYRAAVTVTGTSGSAVGVSEWTNLPVRGMGFNALLRPASKQLMLSVQQP
jgi:hypothetical protein